MLKKAGLIVCIVLLFGTSALFAIGKTINEKAKEADVKGKVSGAVSGALEVGEKVKDVIVTTGTTQVITVTEPVTTTVTPVLEIPATVTQGTTEGPLVEFKEVPVVTDNSKAEYFSIDVNAVAQLGVYVEKCKILSKSTYYSDGQVFYTILLRTEKGRELKHFVSSELYANCASDLTYIVTYTVLSDSKNNTAYSVTDFAVF